jgi:mannose-6-phosphate isomerase-like protein (cupin superfamily)
MEQCMTGPTVSPTLVSTQAGLTYRVGTHLITLKARAAETNGVYSLFETQTPQGQGVRLYRQRYEDEAFWVLNGHYTFLLGSEQVNLSAGDYLYVPRGTVHAYTNRGSGAAHLLVLVTPGGIRERFLADVADRSETRAGMPPLAGCDLERLRSRAARYGIEILPSPRIEPAA